MPLKSVCEAFSEQRAECQLDSWPDSQTPVTPGARPGAALRPHRQVLRVIYAHLKDELELFGDVKGNQLPQTTAFPDLAAVG